MRYPSGLSHSGRSLSTDRCAARGRNSAPEAPGGRRQGWERRPAEKRRSPARDRRQEQRCPGWGWQERRLRSSSRNQRSPGRRPQQQARAHQLRRTDRSPAHQLVEEEQRSPGRFLRQDRRQREWTRLDPPLQLPHRRHLTSGGPLPELGLETRYSRRSKGLDPPGLQRRPGRRGGPVGRPRRWRPLRWS